MGEILLSPPTHQGPPNALWALADDGKRKGGARGGAHFFSGGDCAPSYSFGGIYLLTICCLSHPYFRGSRGKVTPTSHGGRFQHCLSDRSLSSPFCRSPMGKRKMGGRASARIRGLIRGFCCFHRCFNTSLYK